MKIEKIQQSPVGTQYCLPVRFVAFSYSKTEASSVTPYVQHQKIHCRKIIFLNEYKGIFEKMEVNYMKDKFLKYRNNITSLRDFGYLKIY